MIPTVGEYLLSWGRLILLIVLIKLIVPKIEDIPAKCKLKIAISTDGPECPMLPDSGGYKVQPVPAPSSTKADPTSIINAGSNNKNLNELFSRGLETLYIGEQTNYQPPINTGITKKRPLSNHVPLDIVSSPNMVPREDNLNPIINKLKINPPFPPQSR